MHIRFRGGRGDPEELNRRLDALMSDGGFGTRAQKMNDAEPTYESPQLGSRGKRMAEDDWEMGGSGDLQERDHTDGLSGSNLFSGGSSAEEKFLNEELFDDEYGFEEQKVQEKSPVPIVGAARAVMEFGKAHFAVIAVVCIVLIVAAAGQLLKAHTSEITAASTSQSPYASRSMETVSFASSSPSPSGQLIVHVTGAVVSPGVQKLPQGARVADAIAAAGGLREDANPAELNMASQLPDGAQIIIGTRDNPRGEIRGPNDAVNGGQAVAPGGEASSPTSLINLNTADESALQQLSGVGPSTAGKIITWRTSHGKFTSINQLQDIDGIGAKLFEKIKDHVVV